MLEKYMDRQKNACNIMLNEIKNGHISHAYLFDENNCNYAYDLVISFVKEVVCSRLDEEERDVLCKRIDDGNYAELKVIEPDGMLIKKQQILDLQRDFSRCAVEGSKRIYIIRDADKMRNETANSMLKFLEEPDNDILAILMTNNYNNLLSTITSRCQLIRLNNNSNSNVENEIDAVVLKFIKNVEKNGLKTIVKEQDLLFDIISSKDREKIVIFFDKLIDMYYDILKKVNGTNSVKYDKYLDDFIEIAKSNSSEEILRKISCIIKMKDTIKSNVNINLLIDSLIVNIGGRYECSRS